ncbi:MAG: hypothetical protein Q9227_008834 [Pyrenula ochraceoflavens]
MAEPATKDVSAPKSGKDKVSSNQMDFLYNCIKYGDAKPKPNMKSVAPKVGMSVGGAQNKLREIVRNMNNERVAEGFESWDDMPVVKTPTKRKAGRTKDENDDEASPIKKAKTAEADSPGNEENGPKKKSARTTIKPLIIKKDPDSSGDSGEDAGTLESIEKEADIGSGKGKAATKKKAGRKPVAKKAESGEAEDAASD